MVVINNFQKGKLDRKVNCLALDLEIISTVTLPYVNIAGTVSSVLSLLQVLFQMVL